MVKLNHEVEHFKAAAVKMAEDSLKYNKELKLLRSENKELKEEKVYLVAGVKRNIVVTR